MPTGTFGHGFLRRLERAGRLFAVAVVGLGFLLPVPVRAAEGDLAFAAEARWKVDVTDRSVAVDVEVSTGDGGAFGGVTLSIPPDAEDVVVDVDGVPTQDVELDPGPDLLVVDVTVPEARTITVHFRLRDRGFRVPSSVRVNDAYFFVPAWAWGDPGHAVVVVDVPDTYEVFYHGDVEPELRSTLRRTILEVTDLDDPETFVLPVSGRRTEAMTAVHLEPSGASRIVVRGWPGDDEWLELTTATIEGATPLLADLVGLPWPVKLLEVWESIEPSVEGYGGWFLEDEASIEIGEDLDPRVVVHELTHLWFHEGLFTERWITEGLAEVFADHVVATLGHEAATPTRPRLDDPAAFPLDGWPPLGEDTSEDVDAREVWAYDASWWLVDEIVDEAGIEEMAPVFEAAARDLAAYRADDVDPETVAADDDTRRFLDLVEELTGAEIDGVILAEFTGIPDAVLADRAAARRAYAALAAAGDGWSPPWAVRRAMGEWRFDVARQEMARSEALLARRNELAELLAAADLAVPEDLERRYESAGDLGAVAADLDAATRAAPALVAAAESLDVRRGLLALLGGFEDRLEERWEAVLRRYGEGHYDRAEEQARALVAEAEGASSAGLLRLLLAVGIVGAAAVGGTVLRRRGRGDPRVPGYHPPG
ncbi:MAG TPA: hypothetical protein ENK55_06090 [Actinobacteria bacterium]|nr:hypothetical protein [Actinomycetota bacterium]